MESDKNDLTVYQAIREDIKTGDRISFHGESAFSRLIRRKTGDFINHEALVIRLTEFEGYGFEDSVYVIEAGEDGFIQQPLSQKLKAYEGQAFWNPLLDSIIRYYTEEIRKKLAAAALCMRGTPYDWGGVIRRGFCENVELDTEKLFCSEALKAVGLKAGLCAKTMIGPTPGKEVDDLKWWACHANAIKIL
jgi:hypothetical protein